MLILDAFKGHKTDNIKDLLTYIDMPVKIKFVHYYLSSECETNKATRPWITHCCFTSCGNKRGWKPLA
jgi:hypothetical protein